ncbi:MAG: hypothetical protein ACQES2_06430 [Pseudomonadota bacterium]
MEVNEARELFKLDGPCQQEELERLYNFEKNLLLQRLADDASEEELAEVQQQLENLEAAYSTLSTVAAASRNDTIEDDDDSEDGDGKQKLVLLGLILALLIAAALGVNHFLSKPASDSGQTTSGESQTDKQPGGDSDPAKDKTLSYQEQQEQKMIATRDSARKLLRQWNALSKQYNLQLSEDLRETKENAEAYARERSYSQARFTYNDLITSLREYMKKSEDYLAVYNRFQNLAKSWETMAQREDFAFQQHASNKQQFETIRQEISRGETTSLSVGELEKINFTYTKLLERGKQIMELRSEYRPLKARWEEEVLGSAFYTLTPATKELIEQAETSPLPAARFEHLRDEVFPRLINHFKTAKD